MSITSSPAPQDAIQNDRSSAVHSCNFRYAGRLSNENARTLTSLHEKLALNIASSLEVYLGTTLHVKLLSLEQLSIQDHIASLVTDTYLLPCALNILESNFLLEIDVPLIFPIIDLLLGGTGIATEVHSELTDIDDEIMQSVSVVIVQQIEHSWRTLGLSLSPGRSIKANMVPQFFPANERLVLITFEMEIAGVTGHFKVALPTSFVGYLLRHLKAMQSKKASNLRFLPGPSLRERILDCTFLVSADVSKVRVFIKDLIDLCPGAVLKMKAPLNRPGHLTVESVDIFEADPVRIENRKAAQVLMRSAEASTARSSS
jgi:flagellar motor switch protein FliM